MKKIRYRRISVQIWSDEKLRKLGPDAAIVWLYLLTHPALLSVGCMRAHPDALALEIPWLIEPERFKAAFEQLVDAGMVLLDDDPDSLFLGLRNYLIHNPPFTPKVVKSWHNLANLVPECSARDRYFAEARKIIEDMGERFATALPDILLKDLPEETAHA